MINGVKFMRAQLNDKQKKAMFQLIINTYTYYIKIKWEMRRHCLRNLMAHENHS